MLKSIIEIYRDMQSRWLVNRLSPMISPMVKACPRLIDIEPSENWKIHHVFRTLGDMEVLVIGPRNNPVTAILQIPGSKLAVASYEHQKSVLAQLQEDGRLSDWRKFLPHLLYEGYYNGRPYWVFERIEGVEALAELQAKERQDILQLAAKTVGFLHQRTAEEIIVDDAILDKWVLAPLRVIYQSPLVYYHCQSKRILDRLAKHLMETLRGRTIAVSWIHGDYWQGNILFSSDHRQVVGIIDWDQARSKDLPSADLINLLVSACRAESGRELGEILVETHSNGWQPDKEVVWEQTMKQFDGKTPDLKDSLMLFWLRHMSANLLKSGRYLYNPIWANGNYRYVLQYLLLSFQDN
jgi:thiamine kinase-like enzyme